MAWRSRGKPEEPPTPGNDLSDDWDVNNLLADPAPRSDDKPAWLADEDEVKIDDLYGKSGWADLDMGELEKARMEREHAETFGERLKRGELGVDDIPDTGASGFLFGLGALALRPFTMIFENLHYLMTVGLVFSVFVVAAYFLISLMQGTFGY